MKKIGIIRCQQTEDMCPGAACFKSATKGKLAFEEYGVCEIVGFISCGGYPGKRSIPRAKLLVDKGAEIIVFSSCIFKGTPIGFPCPNAEKMETGIKNKIGEDIIILQHTH